MNRAATVNADVKRKSRRSREPPAPSGENIAAATLGRSLSAGPYRTAARGDPAARRSLRVCCWQRKREGIKAGEKAP